MRLLTFNHYSINDSSTIDEVNEFFLELSKGIKKYILENGIQKSRFFTELENFIKYEIIKGYKIIDAIKALSRDLQSIILDLITMRCNDDCLNKLSEEDEVKVTDYEIIFPDEAPENDYMILSFALEKNGILLSFNQDRWIDSTVEVLKYKDNLTEQAYIDNIATEEHANSLISKAILEELPNNNIVYSKSFQNWLLSIDTLHREKTIEKLQFVASKNFEGRRENSIAPITTERIEHLKEIIVGSAGGMSYAQIRVLFKSYNEKYLILNGFIKQNESSQDKKYDEEIEIANKIFEDIKKETNEI